VEEYLAVHGCLRALTTAVVAVRDYERTLPS
jgi:hypothetical protein